MKRRSFGPLSSLAPGPGCPALRTARLHSCPSRYPAVVVLGLLLICFPAPTNPTPFLFHGTEIVVPRRRQPTVEGLVGAGPTGSPDQVSSGPAPEAGNGIG